MLKIKDSVDLKELEKFGFTHADFNVLYMIKYIPGNLKNPIKVINEKMEYYRTLYIDKSNKNLFAYNDFLDCEIPMKKKWIKDLIKADLVEKVEE